MVRSNQGQTIMLQTPTPPTNVSIKYQLPTLYSSGIQQRQEDCFCHQSGRTSWMKTLPAQPLNAMG